MANLNDMAREVSDARFRHGFARDRHWLERIATGAMASKFEAAYNACPDQKLAAKARAIEIERMREWLEYWTAWNVLEAYREGR